MLLTPAIVMHWTHTPLRVFVAFWCLMSLAVSACYTSKLTSLLVDVTPPPPFTSLSGMLERGDFRWGSLKGGRFLTHLRVRVLCRLLYPLLVFFVIFCFLCWCSLSSTVSSVGVLCHLLFPLLVFCVVFFILCWCSLSSFSSVGVICLLFFSL